MATEWAWSVGSGSSGKIRACLRATRPYITPSTKLMTLFSWRRIGRGIRENSSSPTWPSLSDPKVRTKVVHHFLNVYGTDTAQRIRLHILVQQFIRIQFRAVRWQAENSDLRRMLYQPSIHQPGLVYRVTIHNQKHFPPGLPRQSQETTKKIQKHPRRETLTKTHEGQPPPIGDGRDHVAAKALTGAHHHRRLPATSVGSSRLMVRTETHLV